MRTFLKGIFILCLLSISLSVFARQNNDEVKNTCEVSGGKWTESASGWACCWDDWGCYGCVNGVCKIKCHNERCRRANSVSRPGTGTRSVKGLAPAGSVAPIVPKLEKGKNQTVIKNKS